MSIIAGCAGGVMTITANDVHYPVSLTQGLYDVNGRLLGDEDYRVVGTISLPVRKSTWLWTIVNLSEDPDISSALDSLTSASRGQAIVNLSVTQQPSTLSMFSWLLFGGGLLLPSTVEAVVTGEIVQIKN